MHKLSDIITDNIKHAIQYDYISLYDFSKKFFLEVRKVEESFKQRYFNNNLINIFIGNNYLTKNENTFDVPMLTQVKACVNRMQLSGRMTLILNNLRISSIEWNIFIVTGKISQITLDKLIQNKFFIPTNEDPLKELKKLEIHDDQAISKSDWIDEIDDAKNTVVLSEQPESPATTYDDFHITHEIQPIEINSLPSVPEGSPTYIFRTHYYNKIDKLVNKYNETEKWIINTPRYYLVAKFIIYYPETESIFKNLVYKQFPLEIRNNLKTQIKNIYGNINNFIMTFRKMDISYNVDNDFWKNGNSPLFRMMLFQKGFLK